MRYLAEPRCRGNDCLPGDRLKTALHSYLGRPSAGTVSLYVSPNTKAAGLATRRPGDLLNLMARVISSAWDRVTMEYVEGQTLKQAWPVFTSEERSSILTQLSGYIAQLRAVGGMYLGRLDGRGVVVPNILTRCGGPFGSLAEFHDWLLCPPERRRAETIYWY